MSETDPPYRSADMIELHDAGFIVRRRNVDRNVAGWREQSQYGGHSLSVSGEVLGQIFNPNIPASATCEIQQRSTDVGGGFLGTDGEDFRDIRDLSAWVEAPQLLHMRVEFFTETDDKYTAWLITKSITYSGRFTVWWSESTQRIEVDVL